MYKRRLYEESLMDYYRVEIMEHVSLGRKNGYPHIIWMYIDKSKNLLTYWFKDKMFLEIKNKVRDGSEEESDTCIRRK